MCTLLMHAYIAGCHDLILLHVYVKGILFMHVHVYDNVQADKVVQLYETMLTRHTCMVVGPTGGGKSVVINTLAQSQTR